MTPQTEDPTTIVFESHLKYRISVYRISKRLVTIVTFSDRHNFARFRYKLKRGEFPSRG